MKDTVFLQMLENLADTLSGVIGRTNARQLVNNFYSGLGVKQTGKIAVNDLLGQEKTRKASIVQQLMNIENERKMVSSGIPPKEEISMARKEGLTHYSRPGQPEMNVTLPGENISIFGKGTQEQQTEYPMFQLTGVPNNLSEIESYVERWSGKNPQLRAQLANALHNITNIPLAMYYGENVPTSNLKDLMYWSLYNQAEKYPSTVRTGDTKINIPAVPGGSVGLHYNSPTGSGSAKPNTGQPVNIAYKGQSGLVNLVPGVYIPEKDSVQLNIQAKKFQLGDGSYLTFTKDGIYQSVYNKNTNSWVPYKRDPGAVRALEDKYGLIGGPQDPDDENERGQIYNYEVKRADYPSFAYLLAGGKVPRTAFSMQGMTNQTGNYSVEENAGGYGEMPKYNTDIESSIESFVNSAGKPEEIDTIRTLARKFNIKDLSGTPLQISDMARVSGDHAKAMEFYEGIKQQIWDKIKTQYDYLGKKKGWW